MWQSADPILATYLDGKANGGVQNPFNLSLYTYTYLNPIKLRDPDGRCPEGQIGVIGGGSAYCRDMTFSEAHPTIASFSNVLGLFNKVDGVSVNPLTGHMLSEKEKFEEKFGLAMMAAPVAKGAQWGAGFLGKVGAWFSEKLGKAGGYLYRVVDDVELADIKKTGAFRTVAGQFEGKQFVDNSADAQKLQKKFSDFFGGNQTIVKGKAPQSVLDNASRTPFSDIPNGTAITVPKSDLPAIKPEL